VNVKSIIIELVPDEKEEGHATRIEFTNGMWTANGPMYPRIGAALSDIFYLLRGKRG
jgi:hypothetical protein